MRRARRVLLLEESSGAPGVGGCEISMQPARAVFAVLALGLGWLLVACARQEALRRTSQDLPRRGEALRGERTEACQRSAELEPSLRDVKGQDLSQILGQLDTQ